MTAKQKPAPIATPPCGPVKGRWCRGAAVFSGIPYGRDCDGEHRFMPPRPARSWTWMRRAYSNGPYAVQLGAGIFRSELGPYFTGGRPQDFGLEGERQSENCLVLNVVTPAVDAARRPVVVYIHGGGYSTGSGGLVLGAGRWATEQDIVLVGVNHRLNVFGYLYLGGLASRYADTGMAGILDLVLALEWVRDNIAAFGGDADNVTVLGESGGGYKINTLLAMPCARGLFAKAVVESGSAPTGANSRENAMELTRSLLRELGAADLPGQEQLRLLQNLPAEALLKASMKLPGMGFAPVANGVHLAYQAARRITAPACSAHVPLLVGCSTEEDAVFTDQQQLRELTWGNLCSWLERLLSFRRSGPVPVAVEALPEVVAAFRSMDEQASPAHIAMRIVSAAGWLGGGAFHQALAAAERGTAPVYSYLVQYASPLPGLEGERFAWHTAELPLQMRVVLDKASEPFSRMWSAAIAAFARTGVPAIPGCEWPAFTQENPAVMVLDEAPHIEADPQNPVRLALQGRDLVREEQEKAELARKALDESEQEENFEPESETGE